MSNDTKDALAWLSDGKPKSKSKFLNQRLEVGDEYVGKYTGARRATNNYGKTMYYIFYDNGTESIFDSKDILIAQVFASTPVNSTMLVKKVFKDDRIRYEVKPVDTDSDRLCI